MVEVVVLDISESSVEACKGRYCSPRMAMRGSGDPPFGAEFHVADCCSVSLSLSLSLFFLSLTFLSLSHFSF